MTDAEMQSLAAEFQPQRDDVRAAARPTEANTARLSEIFNRQERDAVRGAHPNVGTGPGVFARSRPTSSASRENRGPWSRSRFADGTPTIAGTAAIASLGGRKWPAELLAGLRRASRRAMSSSPITDRCWRPSATPSVESPRGERARRSNPPRCPISGRIREGAQRATTRPGSRAACHSIFYAHDGDRRCARACFSPMSGTVEDPATGSAAHARSQRCCSR